MDFALNILIGNRGTVLVGEAKFANSMVDLRKGLGWTQKLWSEIGLVIVR